MQSSRILTAIGIGVLLIGIGAGCGSVTPVGDDGGGGASGGASGGTTGSGGGSGGSTGGSGGGTGGQGGGGGGGRDAGSDGSSGCVCPQIFAPVCGADGRTYDNSCAADCAGVAVSHQGACTASTDAGTTRGSCNVASDCVFKSDDGCCGSCLNRNDQAIPPSACTAVLCALPPLSCSCANNRCSRSP